MSNDDVFCATHNYGDQPCIIPVEQPYTSPVDNPGKLFTDDEMQAMCLDPVVVETYGVLERVIVYREKRFYALVRDPRSGEHMQQPKRVTAKVIHSTVWMDAE